VEFTNVEDRHPLTVLVQAIVIFDVTTQASVTTLPMAGKRKSETREQFFKRSHCPSFANSENPNGFEF
jgi:hypothetical protein